MKNFVNRVLRRDKKPEPEPTFKVYYDVELPLKKGKVSAKVSAILAFVADTRLASSNILMWTPKGPRWEYSYDMWTEEEWRLIGESLHQQSESHLLLVESRDTIESGLWLKIYEYLKNEKIKRLLGPKNNIAKYCLQKLSEEMILWDLHLTPFGNIALEGVKIPPQNLKRETPRETKPVKSTHRQGHHRRNSSREDAGRSGNR